MMIKPKKIILNGKDARLNFLAVYEEGFTFADYEFSIVDFRAGLKILLRHYRGDTFVGFFDGKDCTISELIELTYELGKDTIIVSRETVKYLNNLYKDRKK